MDEIKRGVITNKIRNLDPNNEIVKIDLANNTIRYDRRIIQHRKIEKLTDEEIVRAYYIVTLIKKLEYPIERLELEKSHKIGRKEKKTEVRIDIKVNKNSSPFMLFELKEPHKYEKDEVGDIKTQLFKVAGVEDPRAKTLKWLVYCTVDVNERNEIEETIKVINYNRFRTFEEWDERGRLALRIIPKKYGTIVTAKYVKGGLEAYKRKFNKDPPFVVLELKSSIPKEKLEKIRKKLHNTLWAGGKKEYNKIFFNLVKLILAKVYDEKETMEGDPYKFQIVYRIKDDTVIEDLNETYKNVLELYRKAFTDPEYLGVNEEELKFLKKREGAIDIIEFEEFEIAFILEQFQEYELTKSDYEFLGDFFETIIREEFKQETGQYFTHKNIVKFILYALELDKLSIDLLKEEKRLPYIIDPACGSGTFLIEAMKLIHKFVLDNKRELENMSDRIGEFIRSNFSETKKLVWAQDYIYGIEFNPSLGVTTKVNMMLHGDGHIHAYLMDALSDFDNFDDKLKIKSESMIYDKPVNEQFDVVISNPPFSVSLDPRTKQKLDNMYLYGSKKASENLFIERWYQLLKPKGRLGVVLPESVFDTTDNMYMRELLFKYLWIKAIVSLEGGQKKGAFAPYTATKTCLLFAQKKDKREVEEWSDIWKKFENEYIKLRRKLSEKIEKKELELGETKENRKDSVVELLKLIFGDNFDEKDEKLPIGDLIIKYKKMLKEKKLKDWWIFSQTARYVYKNYPIKSKFPIFHTEEIGYKRTKRGERKRPNYLFRTKELEDGEEIIIDTESSKTILDIIRRDVKWD